MARTISPDYDRRRDAIVTKAARLYAQNGFLGASVADLAKACKMSKSLIYHYFPSKEDILFAVMSSHLDELTEIINTSLRDSGPNNDGPNNDDASDRGGAHDRLHALTQAFMAKYVGATASHKVLLNELDNLPANKRPIIINQQREIIHHMEGVLCDILPELKHEKHLQQPIAMLYFGMINWTHTWYDAKGAVPSETLADLAVELFVNGLKTLRPKDYA